MANKHNVLSVFIDIEKVYDMVNKEVLLSKLLSYGISGRMFHFIRSFLSNRTFQVRIDSTLSMTKRLENGTPQGSVLNPILFFYDERSPKANHLSCCPLRQWFLTGGTHTTWGYEEPKQGVRSTKVFRDTRSGNLNQILLNIHRDSL